MQQYVQKSSRTIFPFRSRSWIGPAVLIQAVPPLNLSMTGPLARPGAVCWAEARVPRANPPRMASADAILGRRRDSWIEDDCMEANLWVFGDPRPGAEPGRFHLRRRVQPTRHRLQGGISIFPGISPLPLGNKVSNQT